MKGSLKSVLKEDSPREVRQLLCECYLKNGEALPFSLLQNQLSCRVCYKQRKSPSSPPWRTCSASCSTGSADTSSTHCTECARRHTPERCRSANSQSPPSESDSLRMIATAYNILPEAICFMPSNMKYSTIKQSIRNYRPSREGVSP